MTLVFKVRSADSLSGGGLKRRRRSPCPAWAANQQKRAKVRFLMALDKTSEAEQDSILDSEALEAGRCFSAEENSSLSQ